MSTVSMRRERGLGGAHWESWMRLAGDTTFNLIGGSGARPEFTAADAALALAAGSYDRLGSVVAFAIATQNLRAWPMVLVYGFASTRNALLNDRVCADLVREDDARSRRGIYTAMTASFTELVAGAYPRYKKGALKAGMRWAHYRAMYDVTRDHLQCAADEAAASAWKVR